MFAAPSKLRLSLDKNEVVPEGGANTWLGLLLLT